MTTAFLYPGQGAQRPSMISALPDGPATRLTIDEAAEALGGIDGLDSATALESTTNTQLALLICGAAAARTLETDYEIAPVAVAGHSAGAFAAAVTAGVIRFSDALAAVRLRGQLMTEACASGEWGMAAITGLRLRGVRDLVDRIQDQLWIANINAADQVVLGGKMTALHEARQLARGLGARDFEMLDVAVASHGPLQERTARALAQYFSGLPCRRQTTAYMTNIGARRIKDDAAAVLDDLANAVAHPVRWYDIACLLPEFGVTAALQMPPGRVLSRLTASATPQVQALAAADGFDVVSARLRRVNGS